MAPAMAAEHRRQQNSRRPQKGSEGGHQFHVASAHARRTSEAAAAAGIPPPRRPPPVRVRAIRPGARTPAPAPPRRGQPVRHTAPARGPTPRLRIPGRGVANSSVMAVTSQPPRPSSSPGGVCRCSPLPRMTRVQHRHTIAVDLVPAGSRSSIVLSGQSCGRSASWKRYWSSSSRQASRRGEQGAGSRRPLPVRRNRCARRRTHAAGDTAERSGSRTTGRWSVFAAARPPAPASARFASTARHRETGVAGSSPARRRQHRQHCRGRQPQRWRAARGPCRARSRQKHHRRPAPPRASPDSRDQRPAAAIGHNRGRHQGEEGNVARRAHRARNSTAGTSMASNRSARASQGHRGQQQERVTPPCLRSGSAAIETPVRVAGSTDEFRYSTTCACNFQP